MEHFKACPICCSGHLVPEHYSDEISYKNVRINIERFEHSVCSHCETSLTDSNQSKTNKLLVSDFRRIVDGLLPSYEIHRIRKKLKLNVKDASKIIGGGGIAFSKYETGVVNQSLAVDNLLRVLDENPALLTTLESYRKQRELASSISTEIFVSFGPGPRVSEHQPVPLLDFAEKVSNTIVTTFERVLSKKSRSITSNSFIGFGSL